MANPFPSSDGPFRLGCWSYGPDNADAWVEEEVNKFLNTPGGWLILNLDGLDEEGWGAVELQVYDRVVKTIGRDWTPQYTAGRKGYKTIYRINYDFKQFTT